MSYRFAMFSMMVCLAVSCGCSGDKAPSADVKQGANAEPAADATQTEKSHPDFTNLIGKWKIISSQKKGEPNEAAVGNFFTFDETNVDAWIRDFGDLIAPYELDPTVEPKHLTVKLGRPPNDRIYTAIYELDGDSLKMCFKDRERPTGYKSTAENEWTSHVFQRTESYE